MGIINNPNKGHWLQIQLTMSKRDAQKGLLLLEEIESLYGHAPSLEQMIASLGINYLNEYKAGNRKYAIDNIISLLKQSL